MADTRPSATAGPTTPTDTPLKVGPYNPAIQPSCFGRPTKYRPEYCQAMVDFFNRPVATPKQITKTDRRGNVVELETDVPCDIPTFAGFAASIECGVSTLYQWAEEHEDFAEAFTRARALQEHILVVNSAHGRYDTRFTALAAQNWLGWGERRFEQHQHSGTVALDVARRQLASLRLEALGDDRRVEIAGPGGEDGEAVIDVEAERVE